ncbi:MAG: hypothetical protein ABS34_00985 [Opitutaceae bacterium BACL24 MAG-120322-bin51]|jgi:hypothetical protein|nr:MAG: hypothetical protein ABS34_00985 [Opitutaceae bacterium BACL24 MAG-120322-bin51]
MFKQLLNTGVSKFTIGEIPIYGPFASRIRAMLLRILEPQMDADKRRLGFLYQRVSAFICG